jgi:flagellar biogenesis protein FliO
MNPTSSRGQLQRVAWMLVLLHVPITIVLGQGNGHPSLAPQSVRPPIQPAMWNQLEDQSNQTSPPRKNVLTPNTSPALPQPTANGYPQRESIAAGDGIARNGAIALKASSLWGSQDPGSAPRTTSPWTTIVSMATSLLIVLGLFLGLAWFLRRSGLQPFAHVPKDVVQVLGRSPLAPRQQLYLLRFGRKLVLVSHQMGQTQTLSEIEDPIEVDRLCGLCEASTASSVTQSFRHVFQQVATGSPTINRQERI